MATPRKEREQPSDLCEALKADFHEHPGGVAALALAMGANEHTLRSYAADQISGDTFRRVAAMVGHLARAGNTSTINLLCRMCGGHFTADAQTAPTRRNVLDGLCRVISETGEAHAAAAAAIADGRVTFAELTKATKEIDEATEALLGLKGTLRAAVDEIGEQAR